MAISAVRQVPEAEALDLVDQAAAKSRGEIRLLWQSSRDSLAEESDGSMIAAALASGSLASVLMTMSWGDFEDAIRTGLEDSLYDVIEASSVVTADMLGVDSTPIMESANRAWARQSAREAASEESSAARAGLAAAVLLAWRLDVDLTADDVKGVVGIQQAWSTAVVRTQAAFEGESRRAMMVAKEARMRTLRQASALAFAETQSRSAGVTGITQAASAAVQAGLVPGSEWVMEWLARPFGACPICLTLDGQRVEIGLPFYHPEKGSIWGLAHPNCLCSRRVVRRTAAVAA